MFDIQIGDTFTHKDYGQERAFEVTRRSESGLLLTLESGESMRFATVAQLLDTAGPWRRCEARAVTHG